MVQALYVFGADSAGQGLPLGKVRVFLVKSAFPFFFPFLHPAFLLCPFLLHEATPGHLAGGWVVFGVDSAGGECQGFPFVKSAGPFLCRNENFGANGRLLRREPMQR